MKFNTNRIIDINKIITEIIITFLIINININNDKTNIKTLSNNLLEIMKL